MPPIRRDPPRAGGVTLLELVIAMVVTAIIAGIALYFALPLRQSVDVAVRAELTDIADNSLQRIGRDVRLALPNSVRVTGAGQFLEFIPVRTAGRYRADGGGASSGSDCPAQGGVSAPDADQLSFDTGVDTCFKTIGLLPDAATVTAGDHLVLNNYGPGFAGQNAYATGGILNRRDGVVVASEGSRERVSFSSTSQFDRTLHDSPGKRFYIVTTPVSYVCDTAARTLTRYSGYGFSEAQPTTFGGGSAALVADHVAACSFDYVANVAPQMGLLTLRLTLERPVSSGAVERVTLYHAVHVNNVP